MKYLQKHFQTKDTGSLKYFLDINENFGVLIESSKERDSLSDFGHTRVEGFSYADRA